MPEAHKMIRVTYTRHAAGSWHLAGMESSSGVRKLFVMPDYNPASSDPKRQHQRDLFEALQAAGLQARRSHEVCDGNRHEVIIYFDRISPTAAKKGSDDKHEDYLALKQLQAESRQRLSTKEGRRLWLRICRRRAPVAKLLGSRTGPDEP